MDNLLLSVNFTIFYDYQKIKVRYMDYNEKIAKIIGQENICHTILHNIHNNTFSIYTIEGDAGTGKKTLSEQIAKKWSSQSKGITISLNAFYQQNPEDFSVFKNIVIGAYQQENKLFNIFADALKDIPFVGNTLNSIASTVIKQWNQKEELNEKYTESEHYIFRTLQKISQGKDVLLLCYSYELWDLKSQVVIKNFIEESKSKYNGQKVYFIFIGEKEYFHPISNEICKNRLQKVHIDYLEEIVKQFNSHIALNTEQLDKIYNLSDGNLELIKECLDLFDSQSLFVSHSFFDIIRTNIISNCKAKENMLLFLKQAAFIGSEMDEQLLKIFTNIENDLYEEILDEAIKNEYLHEMDKKIYFYKKYVYSIIKDCLLKERKYYIHLSKCLSVLYPSRYDLQMQYLYRGELTEKADRFYFIFLISFYRENNVPFILSDLDLQRLKKNPLYSFYSQISHCYQLYKSKRFEEAEQKLRTLYCEDIAFRFEKDYLLSLITTNSYYTMQEFEERIAILEAYNNIDFQNEYPEMYLRTIMMLSEFYAETDNTEKLAACLKIINRCFSKYSTTDKQIQCYEYCFKLKANAFYKIEISSKFTKEAYNYFNLPENKHQYLSRYYISALNHSANEAVLGNYEKAYKLLVAASEIIQNHPYLKNIHEDIFLNNMAVCGFLCKKELPENCIYVLNNIISKEYSGADIVLLKNNLGVFYILNDNIEEAVAIFEALYCQIEYNDDIDEYYRYFILNNYGILLWINKKQDESHKILSEAFNLHPLINDKPYFKARASKISQLIQNETFETVKKFNDWNHILYNRNSNVVGQAWNYWSRLLLFSELQIWSDF